MYGDFRLRFENNARFGEGNLRNRGVLRARIGADYAIGKRVTTGLRLATGSQDNPNTTDVTIGNFNDDLQVSLDLAYLTYASGRVALTGGKFRNPFLKTDMVWDGDVNPQGATGALQLPALAGIPVRAKGMFFVIDEQATGPNSVMEGAQLVTGLIDSPAWKLNVALSYYDYHIGNLLNADAGDIRSNKLTEEGDAYRSDFDLADIIAQVEYDGLGEQWPLRGVADYVYNAGAAGEDDEGVSVNAFVGRRTAKGDWRFRYGYARVETDAVLAAFSHDNTGLPTNYRQHTLSADYVASSFARLNLTWYLYQALDASIETASDRYTSRIRLNVSVSF